MPKVASLIACNDGRVFLRVAASLILLVVCRAVFVDLERTDGEVNAAMIGAGADSSASSSSKVVMVAVAIMVTVSEAVGSSG
mmetsp:Transcript_12290/g.18330  ORF Transcript_12290/g.18330 Transcript_12290/m.18330 type:complete len:82 (-) Transcript_12290:25-270(-)